MKKLEHRLYGYDPVYDRLDRKELFKHYQKVIAYPDPDEVGLYSRTELIDALLGAEDEAWHETFADPEEYPIRRLEEKWGPATTLNREKGQRLYWCWEADALGATKALVTDVSSYEWDFAEGIREGDLLLTAFDTRHPLVVAFEVVESIVEGHVHAKRLATFSNPISVLEIEERLEFSLPRNSKMLSAGDATKTLTAIAELVDDPQPIFLKAGLCPSSSSDSAHAMIAVISLLQQGEVKKITCDGCGRTDPSSLEPHIFRPKMEDILLDVQDHVDDTALLCSACHRILHSASLKTLREFATAPACPECGERNPQSIIWGMPAEPPSYNPAMDKHYMAGCDIPEGILPDWMCRSCETKYKVVGIETV